MTARILVLGGTGMLGHKMVQVFAREFETWTTVRGSAGAYASYGLIDPDRVISGVDALNLDGLSAVVDRVRPQAVINCVGIIKQLSAATDPVLSLTINSLLPHRCSGCVRPPARGSFIQHRLCFQRHSGAYTEEDQSDAADLYGRTKFLGETAGAGAVTIRGSVIGRELQTTSGLVEWFLAQRGRVVTGYTRAIYSGFTTPAMTRIVRSILLDHSELCGTVQVSSGPLSKYDLLGLLRKAYGVPVDIVPDDAVEMDRTLDSSRFRALTGFVPPSWPDMIDEMASDPTPYEQWRASRRDLTR